MAAPMASMSCYRLQKQTCILFIILICSLSFGHLEDCSVEENSHAKEKYSRKENLSERTCVTKSKKCSTPNRRTTSETPALVATFDDWRFDETQLLIETFPIDKIEENYVRQVKNAIFSKVFPIPMKSTTYLVALSEPVTSGILDLDPTSARNSDFFKAFVSGNTFLSGSLPLAHRYGGHQFGYWSGQLGDGRAVMLGEYLNRKGERWELQLKGSGLTPYSRRGDGRAVLRSSVREFLCSEAMYHLGIPTSRALSLTVSSDSVWRDQFYDGHPKQEQAAVVLRLAPSWFRIGSLEILTNNQEISLLRKLTDFVIKHYFPHIDSLDDNRYLAFYSEVVSQTADMIAKWMSVGFAHGVMNTDNFSLLSLTIDYGPFGFLDAYIPDFVPNTSDDEARYSYEKQPDVGHFNLDKLRQALLPLVDQRQARHLLQILQGYADIYKRRFMEIFRKKLGLAGEEEEDEYIVALLLKLMEDTRADFTMTFRQLGALSVTDLASHNIPDYLWALKDLQQHSRFSDWIRVYTAQAGTSGEKTTPTSREDQMNAVNPRYILRNWMAQDAIVKAENGDYSAVNFLLTVLQNPYQEQEAAERANYAQRPPNWARDIRVSCSS